jgi:hypothetical protein
LFFIFNFFAVISWNLFFCKIFCSAFSLAFFLSVQILCLKSPTYIKNGVFSSLRLNSIGVWFQSEGNRNREQKHSYFTAVKDTVTWLFTFLFSMFYRKWTEVCRGHHLSSFIMVNKFCEMRFYTLHFYQFIQSTIQSEKYKSRFHSERPYNSESESKNAVRKGENLIQVSFICLIKLILSKILFLSRYISHQISILILQFGYRLKC